MSNNGEVESRNVHVDRIISSENHRSTITDSIRLRIIQSAQRAQNVQ